MDRITQYTEETYWNKPRTSVSRKRPPAAEKPKRKCQAVLEETLLPSGKSIKVTCNKVLRIAVDDKTQIDLCTDHGRIASHFIEYCETHENNPEWTSFVLKAKEDGDKVPQTSKKRGNFKDIYQRYKPKPKSEAKELLKRFDTPPPTEERDELIFLPYKPEVEYTVIQTPMSTRSSSVLQFHDTVATAEYDDQVADTIPDTLPEREKKYGSTYRFYHEDPSKLYKRMDASKRSRHLILPNNANDMNDISSLPSPLSPSQHRQSTEQTRSPSTYAEPAAVTIPRFEGAGGGLPTPQNDVNTCGDIWSIMPGIETMHNDPFIPQWGLRSEMVEGTFAMGFASEEVNVTANNGRRDTLISQTQDDSSFGLHQNMCNTTYLRSEPTPIEFSCNIAPLPISETPLDLEATLKQYQQDTGVAIAYPASNVASNEPLPVGTRYDLEPALWSRILSPPESENEVGVSNFAAEGGHSNVQDDYPSYNSLSIGEAQDIIECLGSGTTESCDITNVQSW